MASRGVGIWEYIEAEFAIDCHITVRDGVVTAARAVLTSFTQVCLVQCYDVHYHPSAAQLQSQGSWGSEQQGRWLAGFVALAP